MRNDATAEAPARLELDRFLPYRLSVLTNKVSDAIAREYSERFDLTIPEWRVMAALGNTPGLSASEVAAKTAMDKVQVSRAVARLAEARRVTRRADPGDGRITRLALSANGQAIYDEIVPLALELEAQLMATLTAEERANLERIMAKLARQIAALDG
jgi:DNA-binding MarR family transcriptional regulator